MTITPHIEERSTLNVENESQPQPRIQTPKGEKPNIMLIPFDPESEEQSERLRLTRVACGWKADKVPLWREKQRSGDMSIHWIVFDPADPRKEAWLAQHVARYPAESSPIHDTATHIGGRPRDSTSATSDLPFIPLGTISIDLVASTPVPAKILADPETHRFHISAFYISRALHGSGIGGKAMAAAESMAVRVLHAKVLTLDTLDKRAMLTEEEGGLPGALSAMRRLGEKITPGFSTQAWYERMGYKVIRTITEFDPKSSYVIRSRETGEEYCLPSVWMERVLV